MPVDQVADAADYTIWADNFTGGGGGSAAALPAADGVDGQEDVLARACVEIASQAEAPQR